MSKVEKEPINIVHQNAVMCETIMKEQRNHRLYTNYSINPFRKMHTISGKPNSIHDSEEGEEDEHFLYIIRRGQLEPTKKYSEPQTESQEYGWISSPLMETDRSDRRLNFPRSSTAITQYMEAAWKLKEQRDHNQPKNAPSS